MLHELNYAWRKLKKTPGFTLLTLFVLAAGLSVAIYMYQLVKTLAYADTPFPDHERLVAIDIIDDGFELNGGNVNWYDFVQFSKNQSSFETLIADTQGTVIFSGLGLPKRLQGSYTHAAAFDLTKTAPLLGRRLLEADEHAENPHVAVLSYMLWQRDFAGDKTIIGKVVKFDDKPTTIVGVMPADYSFPMITEVWLPVRDPGIKQAGEGPQVLMLGKLKAGISIKQADADLKAIAARIAEQFPATNGKRSIKVWPLTQITMNNSMPIIALQIGVASLILILVILNAGNLLLVRAISRQKEIAIRAALGAPRFRLIREFLTEALLLSFIAAIIGTFAASWAGTWSHQQIAAMSESMPFWWSFEITGKTLLFAFALTLVTALCIGLYPALRMSRGDLTAHLRDGTRGAQGAKVMRMTNALVIAEIVLAVALLIASGVLVKSIATSLNTGYGVRTEHTLINRLSLYKDNYKEPAAQVKFFNEVMLSAERTTGITEATLGSAMAGDNSGQKAYITEGMSINDKNYPSVNDIIIADNYFQFFGVKMLDGRGFDSRDRFESVKTAIISTQFAQKLWPTQSALGKRIKLNPESEKSEWLTVIGVVDNILHTQPIGNYRTETLYVSIRQFPDRWMGMAVHTQGAPLASAMALAQAVANVDPDMPIYRANDFETYLKNRTGGINFIGTLFVALAALAVVLAGSGIYAVIARSVQLRTQELGVRRALGADDHSVLKLLLGQGLKRLVIGGVIGLGLGLPLVMLIGSLIAASTAAVILVSVVVLSLISVIVLLATYIPARSTIKVSPAVALHYE